MLQQSTDVPQGHLAQSGVHVAREQRSLAVPQALVRVHAAAVVAEQRLRHECHALAVLIRHVADDVLVKHHVVRGLDQRIEALIDFALPGRGYFVVMALDVEAHLDHGLHHLRAKILVVIGGGNGEISFLETRPVAQIVVLASGVPAALLGVDEVVAGVRVLVEADVVEDEELGFCSEISRVGQAGILQIKLGFLRDPARIAIVVLACDGVDDVADHHQRLGFVERIDHRRRRVGDQQHVALVDGGPAADAGAVDAETLLERIFL